MCVCVPGAGAIRSLLLRLQRTLLAAPDERVHGAVEPRQAAHEDLQAGGQDGVPVDPAGVERQGDVGAAAGVDGGDNLLADVDGLDDGGEEGVGGADAVEEGRRQLAGLDEDGADVGVGAAQLGGQRGVEGREASLGGGVVGEAGGAEAAEDGGDGDDGGAVGGAQQAGQEGLEGVDGGQQVDGEAAVEGVEGLVGKGAARDDGGVVDEHGGRAEVALDLGGGGGELGLVGHVAGVVGDAAGGAVLHGPRVEHGDGGAAHAVDLGEEEAQARGAARDDDDLVGEVDVARQAVGDARAMDTSMGGADQSIIWARKQSGMTQEMKGWKKVVMRTLRMRSIERGSNQESLWGMERSMAAIVVRCRGSLSWFARRVRWRGSRMR
ncbi:hypothetical protein BN1723_002986 [Verticillium longisporum]|uniref:Uncharacterized protein n=1 Tax=Verticillium longisporum TaxID=100787 RepID=A0A0G4LMM8_VERLO|nr:hypothetical protein BN1723_002986 [Verticillium longisporum]